MKEKLRQLFGGDQKQDKTKEVVEQKVREESMEEEKPEVPEEQEELKKEENIDGEENSLYIPGFEICSYTEKQYNEVLHKLENAQQEIAELEEKLEDAEDRAWHNDKTATALRSYLEEEEQLRKVAEEAAKSAQGAADELERVKTILGAENAAEAAHGLVEELERVKEELKSKNAENKRQSGKIAHLSRIMYERANADRDLRPKRQHTGYAVISSTQKEIKGKKVWETLLSLPCPASLEVQFVDERIRKEFFSEEGLIRNIGITDIYEGNYDSMRSEMRNRRKNPDEINVALSYKLRQNFRGKYWEAIITHTKPLSKIPDDMMLQNDKQKEEKGKKKKKQKQEEKKEVEANQ